MKQPKSIGLVINGLIAIIIGIVFITATDQAIEGILSVLGLFLGIAGAAMLIKAFFFKSKSHKVNSFLMIEGFFNLALGLILFLNPAMMLHFVMLVVGFWAFAIGIMQIYYSIVIRKVVKSSPFIMGGGAIMSILGLFLIFEPEVIVSTIALFIGIMIVILGFVLLFLAYQIHKNKDAFTSYKVVE